jgi:hypothetical protein
MRFYEATVGARVTVLRELYASLEAHAPLVAVTKHRVGAKTLETGARIIGDAVRLRPHPIPGVVIQLGSTTPGRGGPSRPEKRWLLSLVIYGSDVFEVAEVLDALESWVETSRWPTTLLRGVSWQDAQQVEMEDGQKYISAVVNLGLNYL